LPYRFGQAQNFLLTQLVDLLMQQLDFQLRLDVDLLIMLGGFASISCCRFWLIMMKGAA
jgi:hypothetical protein